MQLGDLFSDGAPLMDRPLDVGAVGVWGGLVSGVDQTQLMKGW